MSKTVSRCIRLNTEDIIKLEEIKLAGRRNDVYISNQAVIELAIKQYLETTTVEEIIETIRNKS